MDRIVISCTRPDGSVSVVVPTASLIMEFHLYGAATGTLTWTGEPRAVAGAVMPLDAAQTAAVAFVRQKDVPPDAINVIDTPVSALPATRRFRNAWRQSGPGAPVVDIPLARQQRLTEVRAERDRALLRSDGALLRAQETGNLALQNQLKVYRQALRDLPATAQAGLNAQTTPEQLDAWIPTWPVEPVA